MKFPSIQQLFDSAQSTAKRFPLELLFSFGASVIGILMVNNSYHDYELRDIYSRLLMICNLGLAFNIAFSLYAENKGISAANKWGIRAGILVVLALIYLLFANSTEPSMVLRFMLWALIAHLMVAFLPFWQSGNLNGFWQYNKLLFLRFCTAVLYSGVLFAGLAIAILSTDTLFNLDLDGDIYGQLWFVIAGVFNTTFFLAGIPPRLDILNETQEYPKALKVFTQFVLIPLTSIYLAILLAYEVKILIQFELPKGMVAGLIMGHAVFGILSILLVHPIRNEEGNRWIYLFSRWFYLLMIPLIVLLVLSIWKRVSDYGITEERYFLMLLAVWLGFITLYFLLGRKDNIKIIPISLCVLALLAVYGPQSAFNVSEYAQGKRLEKFIANKQLKNRKKEIHNIVTYLNRTHGIESLQPYIKQDIVTIRTYYEKRADSKTRKETYTRYGIESDVRDSILRSIEPGLDKYNPYNDIQPDLLHFYFKNAQAARIDLDAPALLIEFNSSYDADSVVSWKGEKWNVIASRSKITIKSNNKGTVFNVADKFRRLTARYKNGKPDERGNHLADPMIMQDTIPFKNQQIILRFEQINGNYTDAGKKEVEISSFSGYLILKK